MSMHRAWQRAWLALDNGYAHMPSKTQIQMKDPALLRIDGISESSEAALVNTAKHALSCLRRRLTVAGTRGKDRAMQPSWHALRQTCRIFQPLSYILLPAQTLSSACQTWCL